MRSIKTSLIAEILFFFLLLLLGSRPASLDTELSRSFFCQGKRTKQNEIKIKKFKTETTSGTVTSLITPILSIPWIELFALYIIIAFLFQTYHYICLCKTWGLIQIGSSGRGTDNQLWEIYYDLVF